MDERFYGLCDSCGAKWFTLVELDECPRCDCPYVEYVRAVPPWKAVRAGNGIDERSPVTRDESND